MANLRLLLINRGVKNLKEGGYLNVTKENILTDDFYSLFFAGMLKSNLGQSEAWDVHIKALLEEIKTDD